MRRWLLAAAILAGAGGTAQAVCLADRAGADETLVRCDDGTRGSLRANGFGDVEGRIGRDRVTLRSDGFGGVDGRIGGRRVAARDAGFGDLEISDGRRTALCRDDGFGGLDCR